jgi:hypothetical protein
MTTPHWTDKITISDAARATRKNRATVARAVRDLPAEDGPGGSKLYDTWRLLQILYIGEGGPTYSEAHRLLTIARTKLVERELQAIDAKTMPVEDYEKSFQYYMAIFRSFCLEHEGKTLLAADITDAHGTIVEFIILQLPEAERAAARKAFHDSQLAEIAERIKSLRDKVERDEHAVERARLGKIVQAAYAAAKDNPARETLDALEAAQDACEEHETKSAGHKYLLEHRPEHVAQCAGSRKKQQAEFRAKLLGADSEPRG